ncbi:MAG TPA: hypothetical protein ENI19_03050 [Candidatus Nealsonbacteria bacterium]|uniref:DUF11 domain-containing protein n=1 Tax=marine sediment metagenome TaxID=412755 RepID=A0A0F9XXD8_9ZZZZ|nr:hypothetical protein [Candidatus Nealsonbacteria bacterium]HEB46657.1 hypothetical protein [Candidatus Nealsonbacteria bacterium]
MRRKILTIFIILVILLIGSAVWYYQKNFFSKGILKLEILALTEIELGQEIEYLVKYKNNGNLTIEEPRLIFEYPEGAVIEEGKSLRQEMDLENIYPGEEKTLSFKARLLGKENEAKKAKVALSYRVKNLNTRFELSTSHTALIQFIPLTFEFDFSSKLEAGKNIKIRLNYFSNVDFPLSNLRIEIDYPQGFEFINSKPKGLAENEWEISLLNKAQGGRIEIEGKLAGEVFSRKIFRARLISWHQDNAIVLKEIAKGLELIEPSIYIYWQVNGSPQYTANPDDYLHYEISFKNIGETALENLFLRVKLEGDTLDFDNLQPGSGKFQKEIGTIYWDQIMVPQLRLLPSLEEGKVEFWVQVKKEFSSGLRNPVIKAKINLNQAKEEIITKINSKLVISQKGFFNQGPFQNTGSIPPKVGSFTTYTIYWQVKSFYNDTKNVKAKATLPSTVWLTGEIEVKEAKLSFDPGSREIVWDIGDLLAGKEGQEINFQIKFTPKPTQKGKVVDLIPGARIIGEDTWTEFIIREEDSVIKTNLPDDPTISNQQGIVQ